jgi:hypothetical protein
MRWTLNLKLYLKQGLAQCVHHLFLPLRGTLLEGYIVAIETSWNEKIHLGAASFCKALIARRSPCLWRTSKTRWNIVCAGVDFFQMSSPVARRDLHQLVQVCLKYSWVQGRYDWGPILKYYLSPNLWLLVYLLRMVLSSRSCCFQVLSRRYGGVTGPRAYVTTRFYGRYPNRETYKLWNHCTAKKW